MGNLRFGEQGEGFLAGLLREIFLPVDLGLQEVVGDVEVEAARRTDGRFTQLHAGLFRGPPRLATIAGSTGAD